MHLQQYQKFVKHTYIRPECLDALSKVDSLVLDIDGVIFDVTRSFRVAISRSVQHFFTQVQGLSGDTVLISPDETQLFKLAGGFNNDWELTFAASLFFLVTAKVFNLDKLGDLKARGDLVEFCRKIRASGGGLEAAEAIALEEALPEVRGQILREWRTDLIQQIFQEIYGGIDYCRRLYGFEPVFIKEKGLINKEKLILDREKLRPFHPCVGILTGRTKEETEIAMEKAGLTGIISWKNVLFDDGVHRKPDPQVLKILSKSLNAAKGLYIGDTMDDLQTVINFQKLEDSDLPKFFAGIVVKQVSEVELYAEARADIISLSTNDLLDALMAVRS